VMRLSETRNKQLGRTGPASRAHQKFPSILAVTIKLSWRFTTFVTAIASFSPMMSRSAQHLMAALPQ